MKLWRVAAETREYSAEDLSGEGAAKYPGRWNDAGEAVIYAAPTIALAVLETAAHIDDHGLPLNRFIVEIDLPAELWDLREELDLATLPVGWSAIPAGRASVRVGSAWLVSVRSPILLVPSVIVPEERVTLINPRHPKSTSLSAKATRPFDYNRVLRASE